MPASLQSQATELSNLEKCLEGELLAYQIEYPNRQDD